MRIEYDLTRREALGVLARCHAQILRDTAIARRIVEGRENPAHYPRREENSHCFTEPLDSGDSFKIVPGHFSRVTCSIMIGHLYTLARVVAVVKEFHKTSGSFSEIIESLRARAQFGTSLEATKSVLSEVE